MRSALDRCRSLLFTPGVAHERIAKAAAVGADAPIVDLEDGVATLRKSEARACALEYLRTPRPEGLVRMLRVNALRTMEGLEDWLSGLSCGQPAGCSPMLTVEPSQTVARRRPRRCLLW